MERACRHARTAELMSSQLLGLLQRRKPGHLLAARGGAHASALAESLRTISGIWGGGAGGRRDSFFEGMSPARLFTAQRMAHVQKYTESIQWSQWATNVLRRM